MIDGLYLNKELNIEINSAGINIMKIKGLPSPPSIKNNVRYLSISKALDSTNFNDDTIKLINQKIIIKL